MDIDSDVAGTRERTVIARAGGASKWRILMPYRHIARLAAIAALALTGLDTIASQSRYAA
jgi:lipopolysaccharide export LptBFGC system permease protein LptF